MNRRYALQLLGSMALAADSAAARAEGASPDAMVRIVVPFSAGSMTDILARALAERLAARWRQQVIVENRPGIAGTAGAAKAPADGLTLMLTSNGHVVTRVINPNVGFDPVRDFAGISKVASMPSILVGPPDGPITTLPALIAAAKARPKGLNYSSAGLGSATSIGAELLRQVAGIDMVHVPYRGMPEAQTAIIRGDAAMAFTFFNVGGDLIQAGRMRAFAITGQRRLPQLPDVPTFAEAGLPAFDYDAWFGLLAPAATPRPIVDLVARDTAAILADADLASRFEAQGVDLAASAPTTFDAQIRRDAERYGKLFAGAG